MVIKKHITDTNNALPDFVSSTRNYYGSVITTKEQANELPGHFGTPYENIDDAVVHVNEQFAKIYQGKSLQKLVNQREKQIEENMLETSIPEG